MHQTKENKLIIMVNQLFHKTLRNTGADSLQSTGIRILINDVHDYMVKRTSDNRAFWFYCRTFVYMSQLWIEMSCACSWPRHPLLLLNIYVAHLTFLTSLVQIRYLADIPINQVQSKTGALHLEQQSRVRDRKIVHSLIF